MPRMPQLKHDQHQRAVGPRLRDGWPGSASSASLLRRVPRHSRARHVLHCLHCLGPAVEVLCGRRNILLRAEKLSTGASSMNTLVSVRPSAQVVFVVVVDILPFSILQELDVLKPLLRGLPLLLSQAHFMPSRRSG
jgi:hypothetical protein